MSERRKGRPYDQIPPGPQSDLGAYLYKQLLHDVVKGLNTTSMAVGEFAITQAPEVAKKMRSAVGKLSRISGAAARGRIRQVNLPLHVFPDYDSAENFASAISSKDAELFPVPSSITDRLHHPREHAGMGMARDSLIPNVTTLVTEITFPESSRTAYSVRLVGGARLVKAEPNNPRC